MFHACIEVSRLCLSRSYSFHWFLDFVDLCFVFPRREQVSPASSTRTVYNTVVEDYCFSTVTKTTRCNEHLMASVASPLRD